MSIASEPVRNLGAMFDSQLIMAPHVKSVVKKSSFHLRNELFENSMNGNGAI